MNAALLSSTVNPIVLSGGLIGYWSYNDGVGSTVRDFGPNGNNGTTQVAPTWGKGIVGSALSFDGSTQHVNLNSTGLSALSSGDFSISMWLNWTTVSTYAGLFWANSTGLTEEFDGQYSLVLNDQNVVTTNDYVITTGVWQHVAATRSSTTYKIYLNGVNAAGTFHSDSGWGQASQYRMGIGYNNTRFAGLMDEVRVYNRALSDAEVMALYRII